MFLSTTRWSFNNLERGQWDICMCGGEERQLYSFKFPISPQSTAKQGAWQTNGYDIYWPGRVARWWPPWYPAQQLPDNRITSRSYNHLCVTFVLRAATRQPRRQHWPCWHTRTLAKLRRVFVLLELLTASYNQLEELIPSPTELTVNIVTLRHWVRIGTWQSWSELMLWIKMSLVTIMTIMTTR